VTMGSENTDICDLSVSVITYNSAHCLEGLFDSLSKQHGASWELFVVDNASTDGTAARLAERMVGNVTVNHGNVGYGRAHNQNRPHFRGRHVLFLNPDVTFPAGLFAALVSFLDGNPSVGVVGPSIFEGNGRTAFPPRRFYPGERTIALEPGLRRDYYAWLSGCCLAIRRSVLNEIGGFDPDFFLYQEETDLCLRVRRAGYKLGWCPEWQVFHAHLQSQTGLAEYDQERRLLDGTVLFWQKHFAAADVPNIVRFQYFRASAILSLHERFQQFTKNRAFPREKLRARRDLCREWLIHRGYRIFAFNSSVARIAFRQLHLAMEWTRNRTFPVDDY
jgi:GT2 family glycosyltransferase